jgi:hypothetical protein
MNITASLETNTLPPPVEKEPSYPCLLQYKRSAHNGPSFIVFFYKPCCGMVVWSDHPDRKVGDYCEIWADFAPDVWGIVPSTTTIVLQQTP